MTVLAVDLAAKYSAVCVMDHDRTVIAQWDSWGMTEDEFITSIVDAWDFYIDTELRPDVLVIEDLPHGLGYSGVIKTVCRMQGRIVEAMHRAGWGYDDVIFAAPAAWRAHFGVKRGTGVEAVFAAAAKLGYCPPDLTQRAKGNGGRTRAQKVASDYCSAFCIAHWAVDMNKAHGTYDVAETSRYDTKAIRKKDFDAENNPDA